MKLKYKIGQMLLSINTKLQEVWNTNLFKVFAMFYNIQYGKNLRIRKFPKIEGFPIIIFGNNVYLGKNTNLHFSDNGQIVFGNNVSLTGDDYLSACKSINIGDNTLIAEFVSIRDANHMFENTQKNTNTNPMCVKEIFIGKNVWISRGVIITKGSRIGDNCVIAANAVVKSTFSDNMLIGGIPAKTIKIIKS